jgi:predicted kinase
MTNQIVRKPTLVLMAGFPGAGKTTIASKLSHILQWPVLDKDTIKLSLRDTRNTLNMSLTEYVVSYIAYDLLFAIAHDLLVKQKLSVILDSPARLPFIAERAAEFARLAHAQLKVIHCIAGIELRNYRLSSRTTGNLQHKVDPTLKEENLHFAHLPTNTLTLFTVNSLEECVTIAIRYLTQ